MQKNYFAFTKSTVLPIIMLLAVVSFVIGPSCKKKKKVEPTTVSETAPSFKMNCVRIDSSQVKAWVDSGWTNPAKPGMLIKKILLQFYTADALTANTNMQLISYPAKTYTDVYANAKTLLKIDTTCTAVALTGATSFSNNYLNFAKLQITNPDGSLVPFNFLRLRPVRDYPPYINFDIEIVRIAGNRQTAEAKGKSDPCPTICND